MSKKVLVVYKSVTGFTKKYAEMIAQEADCTLIDFKKVTADAMSNFDIIIFGGRLHAGIIDGLKTAKKLFQQSKAPQLIVYATGVTSNETKDVIDEMWSNNLSPVELLDIPHFYMQGGLCYEKMPLFDKMMMKLFCLIMKKKKNKDKKEEQFEQTIAASYDISSKKYIMPLLTYLNSIGENDNEKS